MENEELKLPAVNEFIFAPFNTFMYLMDDRLLFGNVAQLKRDLIEYLNKEITCCEKNEKFKIHWKSEESLDFKLSKGVFNPPGRESSFVMAELLNEDDETLGLQITEEISDQFPANSLQFKDIKFYFYESGVGTCSVKVELQYPQGLTVVQLEEASEEVNGLFKEYFEGICYELATRYIEAIDHFKIGHLEMEFIPSIEEVDKATHIIPWTHRIYHVHDHPGLRNLENPGEPFRTLVTPTRQMDIEDFSIYDNRYIYFGWGHSLIFTEKDEDGYSQTSRPVTDYVRLVEIAQSKWQFLDVLSDIVDYSLLSFNNLYSKMKIDKIQKSINMIRDFRNAIERILSDFRGIKITFDTEKRMLLNELHDRWLTQKLVDRLDYEMQRIEEFLDQLYQRQKEQREESLNTIALLFTILGAIEVIDLFMGVFSDNFNISLPLQLVILSLGTFLVALSIVIYLRGSTKA
ncbi:MAG: hypothetical protein ACFFCS_06590 [Candidatus Hodarchaeota archaeon]